MNLQTYAPVGDKENSPFFDEYVTKIYQRRAETGLDEIVGDMRGVVVQVEHGDGVRYLAELAAMGPYRFVTGRLTDTHKVYFLQSRPEFPRLIVLEPLSSAYEDKLTRWNRLYPLAARKPNARYVGEVYEATSVSAVREALEPLNIRFVYDGRLAEQPVLARAPVVHVPVGLHVQPRRLRGRRHRRHRARWASARSSG